MNTATESSLKGKRRLIRLLAGTLFLTALCGLIPGDTVHGTTHMVLVENFIFDADDNNETIIDTVSITAGDTVEWQWVEGIHTITSGASSDPGDNPGELFDELSDEDNPVFQYVFPEEGDVPYFCRPHELLDMKGVIRVEGGVGIDDEEGTGAGLPAAVALDQNYPNPFNPVTAITFRIADSGTGETGSAAHSVLLEVYDLRGRLVKTLVKGPYPAGSYQVVWEGRNDRGTPVSSGMYLYRLTVDEESSMRKMVLTR